MMSVFLLLWACERAPVVHRVSPLEVPAGETLVVTGENFGLTPTLTLRGPSERPLEIVATEGKLTARVPRDLQAGVYAVDVGADALSTSVEQGLIVIAPLEDLPCTNDFTANTLTSPHQRQIVLDRFYPAGRRDTLVVPFDSIQRVEYERRRLPSGSVCNAVYLARTDGRRVLFTDGAASLVSRAERLATTIGKALVTVRDDEIAAATPKR